MSDLRNAGAYVKSVDPAMYKRIVSIVGNNTEAVGAYVETVDPEMFDMIMEFVNRTKANA